MRKLTFLVVGVLLDLNNIIFNEIDYIHKTKFSITWKCH